MKLSVKKFSKKSLSLLIALIMVFSALPLTPSISANAAEIKTEYPVWDATSFTTATSSNGTPFTFTDTNSSITLQGVHWGAASKTSGNNYFTFNNATISTQNNISNINGDSWSFSAKFAYSGISNTATLATVFGIGTSTPRTYTNIKNSESTRCVADLVDIRDNGKVYLSLGSDTPNADITLTTEQRNLLFSTSADDYKVLTVRYKSGTVTIDVNGTVIVPSTAVDSTLFSSGVSNYFVGSNVRCTEGGNAPYYKKTNVSNSSTNSTGDFINNMYLYSLSGATYVEPSDISNHGNLTLHWLYSKDYTKDASKNSYDINNQSNVTWETTDNVPSLTFNGNSSVQRSFGQTINNTGISSSIESGGAGVTIAFMAYTNNQYDTPFFTIYGDRTEFSYSPSGRILYRNSSYSASNSATQNIQRTSAISTGTWHKIVIVLKASKSMDVYVDNSTAIKSISNNDFYDNNTWATSHTIKLGANRDGKEKFNGAIRDFRIYNKSLTTSADITALMSDMESNKFNTKSYNVSAVSAYGLLGKSAPGTERLQNGDMNVVNDGYEGNTTIGILRIPLSDFQTGERAGSESKLLLNVASTWYNTNSNQSSSIKSRYDNDLYTDVYYTTNDVSNYVSSSGTRSALSTIALNTDYSTSIATVKSNVSLLRASDATKIGSIPHTTIGQYSLDVANAINATLNAGKKDLYIILVKNAVDGYGNNSNGPWTDTHFLINQQVISYTKVQNYRFENFAGDTVKEVQASSAMEAAEYTPTEVTPPSYEQPTNIPFSHTKYTYYWPDTPTNNVFKEQRRSDSEDCTNEFVNVTPTTHDVVCQFCKHTETLNHAFRQTSTVPSGDVNNGYDVYTCSNCNYAKNEYFDTDWSAYNAELVIAQEEIQNTAKYTAESIKDVTDIIQAVTPNVETKSQKYINDMTTALTVAVETLALNQYSITFNVVDEHGNKTETVINATSHDYGTKLNLQLPDTYQGNAVSAWKRNINGVDSVVGATSHSIQVIITGDATYTAFVKKAKPASENQALITLNNKSNKVYDIGYVEKTSGVNVTVDVDNGSITVGGQQLKAPTYSFYRVTGFKINGKTVTNGTIDITGDLVIMPEYKAIETFVITGGNGVVEKSTTTSWDKRVRLTAEAPAQSGKINKWTSTINGQTVVWGYGNTLSFQATQECTVECTEVDATEFDGAEDVKLSVDYVSYNLYRAKSITAISRVVAPEGTVLEYGTIFKTANIKSGASNANYETQKAAVNNKDNYKVENKSGVFKASQKITNTDQFAYSFYSSQDYDKMYVGAVAYAKLSNGTTVYSDVVTYEFVR